MRRLLLLLPLFALAGCKDPQDGVRVTVTYEQFVPGCIRVTALDDASGEKRSTDVAVRGTSAADDGKVVVAVLLPEKWGTQLTVTADAFEAPLGEGACVSPAVRSHTKGITVQKGDAKKGTPQEVSLAVNAPDLDGDGYVTTDSGGTDCNDNRDQGEAINPAATELCNNVDDNCDKQEDKAFFNLEATCTGASGCSGKRICDPTTQQVSCNSPEPQLAWRDEDGDGYGKADAGSVAFCPPDTIPLVGYVPVSEPHNDCDDAVKTINVLGVEVCDDRDNNCDGTKDNLAPQDCPVEQSQCPGLVACLGTSGATHCVAKAPEPTWYPDNDTDGRGLADAGVASCTIQPDAGYVRDGGDCDDGNPFIYTAAAELCDEQDNNCNSQTDEGMVCGASAATWALTPVIPDATRTWYGVSLYGNGGVWISGDKSGRGVKPPGQTTFTVLPNACADTGRLYGVWANPISDKAFMGGAERHLLIQEADSSTCEPQTDVTAIGNSAAVTDLFGFVVNNNPDDVQIYGVATDGKDGATFLWTGQTASVSSTKRTDTTLQGIHGISREVMFAVGSFKEPILATAKGRILRYLPNKDPSPDWSDAEEIPDTKGLNSVWVVSPKLAYAVGDEGTFLKWDGTTWAKATGPAGGEKLTGVIAFGSNSIYVTSEAGKIHRYDGAWRSSSVGTSLYGINGTSPSDIWSVGVQGKIFHYPAWPQ